MYNNDILIRLRYALDIKNTDMVEIFKLGGVEVTKDEVLKMLSMPKDSEHKEADLEGIKENEEYIKCNNSMVESFLNGFIVFKRGKKDPESGEPEKKVLSIKDHVNINNIMVKKLKIALALTSEDMLDIFETAGVSISKGELSAIFRKEGHKNYKECGDKYARNFLKGLAMKYRK